MNLLHPMFDDSLLFHPLTVSFASLINNLRLRIRKKTICCFANKEKKIKHRKKIIKKKSQRKSKQTKNKHFTIWQHQWNLCFFFLCSRLFSFCRMMELDYIICNEMRDSDVIHSLRPVCFDFIVAAWTASIMAARSPLFSKW